MSYVTPLIMATYTKDQLQNFEKDVMSDAMLWSKTTWTNKDMFTP